MVDKFSDWFVSAYVTASSTCRHAGARRIRMAERDAQTATTMIRARRLVRAGVRFMLLHDVRCDDNNLKAFFTEVHEFYIKVRVPPASHRRRWIGLASVLTGSARVLFTARRRSTS